jgi:hypothetical protein
MELKSTKITHLIEFYEALIDKYRFHSSSLVQMKVLYWRMELCRVKSIRDGYYSFYWVARAGGDLILIKFLNLKKHRFHKPPTFLEIRISKPGLGRWQ